jgi:hypothetical protein
MQISPGWMRGEICGTNDKMNNNLSLNKTQEVSPIPHIETNPQILFSIKRIDAPWKTLFYVTAWKMIPPLFDLQISRSANVKIIAMYVREFKYMACAAGITVANGARVTHVMNYLHHSDERVIPERHKAREYMAKYLNARISEAVKNDIQF